ncbi:hypothetical protein [Brevundimonas sp. FT23042]|uniref:hypothetical protein n=1 Tax=Brevundimonas sp. FT23042 TaxID=3393749 RepID=UPI003B5879E6
MDNARLEVELKQRRRKFRMAVAAAVLGAGMAAVGAAIGLDRTGDAATGWGVLTGVGAGLAAGGAVMAWLVRPGATGWRTEGEQTKRDRLQAQRARQLWMFPLLTLAFLFQSTLAVQDILAGEGNFADYIIAPMPVIYAWIVASIAMGWDHLSRTQKRYLEDELTAVLRARAIAAAFVVLMAGGTLAFVLGLWRTDAAVTALPFVLSAAGATAGIRYAWLDREFGKDA